MNTPWRHPRRGNTILGIIVAIAVIGIVIAMAVPAQMRSSAIRHARQCQQNLSAIEGAMFAVAQDNELERGTPLAMDDLIDTTGTGRLRQIPHCPAGGTYQVTRFGTAPACSIGENPAAPYAPHTYMAPIPDTRK